MYVSLSSLLSPIFDTPHVYFAMETAILGWGEIKPQVKRVAQERLAQVGWRGTHASCELRKGVEEDP